MRLRQDYLISGLLTVLGSLLIGCRQHTMSLGQAASVCNNRSLQVARWGENHETEPDRSIASGRRDLLQAVWSQPQPKKAYQVPKITHHIWYTTQDNPNEINDKDIRVIQESLLKTPRKDGWKHYFWVNDPSLIPKTLAKLAPFDIEVNVISQNNIPGYNLFWQDAVQESQKIAKSMPADMLTYLILDHYGGIYLDTDYELFNQIDDLAESYSFFAFEEPGNQFIGHAIVAAAPHHPIILEAENMIKRNRTQPPEYIQRACSERAYTVLATGPAMFSVAFDHKANHDTRYRDTFFPDDGSLSLLRYAFVPAIWSSQIGLHHGSNTWAKKDQEKLLPGCSSCSNSIRKLNNASFLRNALAGKKYH